MTDPDDPDLLAAEYVLGTADADERALVASRLAAGDAALARAVRAWEDRLAPLAEAAPAVEPPPALREAVARRLFGPAERPFGARRDDGMARLRRRLRRWQAATAAAAALAAALAVYVAVGGRGPAGPPERLVAVLRRDPGSPAMLVDVDLRARRLSVRALDAAPPAGRAYELWIIDPALGAPRSLGLVPARAGTDDSLGAYDPAVIAGATYAVTVEPPGGSPDGRPSAAPVLSGKLVPSAP